MKHQTKPPFYGLLAEFDHPESLVHAAELAYNEGYRKMDAYSPFPIEELTHALHLKHTKLPLIVLIGGIVGGLGGYFLQYFANVIDYPLNIGGRPFNSWPSFIPVTFEMTVLVAALSAVFGMLALNGLPMPYHPVFNVPEFEHASCDRFFLCIKAADPKFDAEKTAVFLRTLHPMSVSEVEH